MRDAKPVFDEVRIEPICQRPMTVQSVGPFTALAFRATIDRPDRFRRLRDVRAPRLDAPAPDRLRRLTFMPLLRWSCANREEEQVTHGNG